MVRIDRGHKSTMNDSGFKLFLELVAHEMRTPLNVISLSTQLLSSGVDAETIEETRDIIASQIEILTRLVSDIADFSIGKLNTESISVQDVVADVAKTIMVSGDRSGYDFLVQPEPSGTVMADTVRLKQVLINLLTNAFKYSPPGSTVNFFAAEQPDHIQFVVSDNGNGIDAEMLSHIFEPFVQDKRDQDREQGGVGLGLALVKTFVEGMQGTVEVHSKGKGFGSTFIVTLPHGVS